MNSLPTSVEDFREIVIGRVPELATGRFTLLTAGWDSIAVDVDDRLVFKFPRHAAAEHRLRREAEVLAILAGAVDMPVPRLTLFDGPPLMSCHEKIPGEHLLAAEYAGLVESRRQALGEAMGQFYAQLHAIPAARFEAAGALALEPWLAPDEIERRIWPLLDETQRSYATKALAEWSVLPPDPYGTIFGYFDGHGWNMAFDHATGTLNGLFDFADSGFAALHREFLYSSMISPELTQRIIAAYESHTGKALDRRRIALTTGVHRLWELAVEAEDAATVPMMLQSLQSWIDLPDAAAGL